MFWEKGLVAFGIKLTQQSTIGNIITEARMSARMFVHQSVT